MIRNAILALVALAGWTASASAQSAWAEKLFEGNLSHDFGTVARGTQMVHLFPITNIYAVRLEITEIKASCGCVTAKAAKRVLGPREKTVLEVRVDGRLFTGPKSYTVNVTVGPEHISTAQLKIQANSRADVVFNPGQVSFGTVAQGSTPTQTVEVEYAGALNWEARRVLARDVPYTATLTQSYRRPGQVGYRLQVTLKGTAPPGVHRHELFLETNDPASPLVPVLVEATVQSSLTVTPSNLPLGAVKANGPLVRRVLVRGTTPFRILGVEGTGDGVELSAPPGSTEAVVQTLTFECRFTRQGPFRRELRIRTSAQEAPLTLTLDGNVVP